MSTQGVTAAEFMALMRERAVSNTPKPHAKDTQEFLEHCCDLGLLRRESTDGTTVYFPTSAL